MRSQHAQSSRGGVPAPHLRGRGERGGGVGGGGRGRMGPTRPHTHPLPRTGHSWRDQKANAGATATRPLIEASKGAVVDSRANISHLKHQQVAAAQTVRRSQAKVLFHHGRTPDRRSRTRSGGPGKRAQRGAGWPATVRRSRRPGGACPGASAEHAPLHPGSVPVSARLGGEGTARTALLARRRTRLWLAACASAGFAGWPAELRFSPLAG